MSELDNHQSFNLVDKPWITAQMHDGSTRDISLTGLFTEGYAITKLAHEDALIDTSVLGVLETIFIRAFLIHFDRAVDEEDFNLETFQSPAYLKKWVNGMLREDPANLQPILEYLQDAAIKERFDLFHVDQPFMQVADLHTEKGARSPVSRIIFDSESDHFSVRAAQGKEILSFAEAAQRVIATHHWDYSGIKSGAVGDSRVKGGKGYPIGTGWYGATGKVILQGKNIIETLLLNMPLKTIFDVRPSDEGPWLEFSAFDDLPAWERDPDTAAQRTDTETVQPTGPCDILTWQSRRVRLFPEKKAVTGVLVSNGDKVSDKFVDAAGRFDPWTGYRYSKNQSSKTADVWMPLQHSAERTLWRGASALLANSGGATDKENSINPETFTGLRFFPEDLHIGVQLVGAVYGTQNSVIETTIDECLPVELALLTEEAQTHRAAITENIQKTMDAAVRLGSFAGQLLVAAGKEYEFQPAPAEAVLKHLENEFRSWMATLSIDDDPENVKASWHKIAAAFFRAEANRMASTASPKAQTGRFRDNNGKEEFVSSATAHNSYLRTLRKTFPLAYPEHRKEKDLD